MLSPPATSRKFGSVEESEEIGRAGGPADFYQRVWRTT